MAFYQKYRAKTFGEMIGQEHVTKTLLESIKSDKFVHAYLLTGPRGIGKTSIARLLAKAINCQKLLQDKKDGKAVSGEPCNECDSCRDINVGKAMDIIEIDAASHTGVDDVRELIDKARLAPTKLNKKVYIIDEVHMLSKNAFNALLKTLEEPPSHVVFILATTETHKIPATILSRAQRFDLKRAQKEEIIQNLQNVAKAEKIEIDADSLDLIALSAAGGHRDALGMLEQIASLGQKITLDLTRQILGIAETQEVFKFIGAIFNNHPEEGLKIARELFDKGLDLADFNRNLVERLRQILLFQIGGEIAIVDTKENIERIKSLALLIPSERTYKLINIFIESGNLFKDVSYPILPIELAVVKAIESEKTPIIDLPVSEVKVASEPKIVSHEIKPDQIVKKVAEKVEPESVAPVPVLEMTRDIWQQVIDQTKKENSTLAALLKDARPEALTDDTLTLSVKFKFHKDRISEPKHRQILEDIVSAVTGSKYQIICQISDGKIKLPKPGADENLEKAVTEVFEIVE